MLVNENHQQRQAEASQFLTPPKTVNECKLEHLIPT